MTGMLRVVATPIGNLADLSPRAADALREADLVLAEDTRRARILLEHVGSHAKLLSCHQHNEVERAATAIERIEAGQTLVFVSDAGAPAVSDPGGRLVEAVVGAELEVEVIPGPSALVAALMGAGLDVHRFAFVGFLPRKAGARRALLSRVDPSFGVLLFEAPGRLEQTLHDLHEALGPRRVVVARELTKRFETFHRGALGGALHPPLVDKGEAVIVVEAGTEMVAARAEDPTERVHGILHDPALRPREKAKAVAQLLGISSREAYALVQAPPSAGGGQEEAVEVPDLATGHPHKRRPSSGLDDAQVRIREAIERSAEARERLKSSLAEAARALVEADEAAATARSLERRPSAEPSILSDVEGIDALLRLLEAPPALPAPVEAADAARALLAALSAADALDDALGFIGEGDAQ